MIEKKLREKIWLEKNESLTPLFSKIISSVFNRKSSRKKNGYEIVPVSEAEATDKGEVPPLIFDEQVVVEKIEDTLASLTPKDTLFLAEITEDQKNVIVWNVKQIFLSHVRSNSHESSIGVGGGDMVVIDEKTYSMSLHLYYNTDSGRLEYKVPGFKTDDYSRLKTHIVIHRKGDTALTDEEEINKGRDRSQTYTIKTLYDEGITPPEFSEALKEGLFEDGLGRLIIESEIHPHNDRIIQPERLDLDDEPHQDGQYVKPALLNLEDKFVLLACEVFNKVYGK